MSQFGHHLFADADLQFTFSPAVRSNTLRRKSSPGHLLRSSRAAAATPSSCCRPIHHCSSPAVRDGALRQRCAHHVHRPRQFAQRRRGGAAPGGGSSRAVRDPPGLLFLPPGNPFRLPPHSHVASWFLLGLGPSPPGVRSTGGFFNSHRPISLVCCFSGDHLSEGIGLSGGCPPARHSVFQEQYQPLLAASPRFLVSPDAFHWFTPPPLPLPPPDES